MSGPPTKIAYRPLSFGTWTVQLCAARQIGLPPWIGKGRHPAVTLFNIAARARRHNEAGTLHEILVAHNVKFGEELNR